MNALPNLTQVNSSLCSVISLAICEYYRIFQNKTIRMFILIIIVIKLMHDISRHIVYTRRSKALSSFLKKEGVIWKMWRLIPLHTNKKKRVRPSHFLYPNYTFVLCVHWPLLLIAKVNWILQCNTWNCMFINIHHLVFPTCQKCFPPMHFLIFWSFAVH